MKTIKQLYYTLDEARGQTLMGIGHPFSDHISVTLIFDPMTLKNHSVGNIYACIGWNVFSGWGAIEFTIFSWSLLAALDF